MTAPDAVGRFTALLVVRGALLLMAGALALRWPEQAVRPAMEGAALLLLAAGVYELGLAARARHTVRAWPVAAADGLASIGYGVLTLAVTLIPVRVTSLLVALWLASYAALLLGLALGLWPMHRTRQLLVVTATAMLIVAGGAVLYRTTTIFTLVYAGAAFAAALGAFQLAAGLWMRRFAIPYFAPTIQSRWPSVGSGAR